MKRFDDKKYIEFKKVKHEIDCMFSEWSTLDKAVEILKEAGDDWPVNYNEDWHWALINAANQYTKRKVMKVLPKVYKDYQFRLANNIAFQAPDSAVRYNKDPHWYERVSLIHLKKGMDYLGEKFVPE